MTTVIETDVTILGAGVIGISSALAALERGLTVTLIDRQGPGEATSYGNAGVISPWSVVPQSLPGVWKGVPEWLLKPTGPVKVEWRHLPVILPWVWSFLKNSRPEKVEQVADAMSFIMRDNVSIYRRYLAGTGREDLLVDSLNVLIFKGASPPSLDNYHLKLRRDRGATMEVIGSADLRDLEPAISHDYTHAVIVQDQARARAPGALVKALAEKAFSLGAQFVQQDVQALKPQEDGSTLLVTSDGDLRTRKLVLSGGIWSAELLRAIGIKLPLIAERGYHLEFSDPGIVLNNSIQDTVGKVIISSMLGGVRTAGTAEFTSVDAPPRYERARALEPLTKRVLPDLQTVEKREWMGIRPSFPDNLPAIGPLPGYPNIIAAFGHSHYGMGMAPVTGLLVADALEGKPANQSREAFRPERYLT